MTRAESAVQIAHPVRVEWSDTDASGHYHHSSVLRWAEQAEAALYRRIGARDVFGTSPRVNHTVDYRSPLWFGDEAVMHLCIDHVGTTSMRLAFEVTAASGTVVAVGTATMVHVTRPGGQAEPWPEDLRNQLRAAMAGQRS